MDVMSGEAAEHQQRVPPLAGEDHVCEVCDLFYLQISVEAALEVIRSVPEIVRETIAAIPTAVHRRRPTSDGWSITEYVCHLRDVYSVYTIRLHRARTEDRPVLEPMLNDLRARRFRYNERDGSAILDELAATAAGFCEEINRTRADCWDRVVTRLPGEERTARWLVRQAMHEGQHHIGDIRRTGEALKA